jgi:hypothetical protein
LAAIKELAERVGFEKALSDRLFAFNKMPKTDVFTVTYLLSHLEHESHKKRSFTPISLSTVWTVWMRFPRHATNSSFINTPAPWAFATRRDESWAFMMAATSAEIYLWEDRFGHTHYPLNVIEAQNWMGVRTDRLLELLVC